MPDFLKRTAAIAARMQALLLQGDGSPVPLPAGLDLSAVAVEPPRDASHGDMATNAAMVLAKPANMQPRAIAEALAARLLRRSARGGGRCGRAGFSEPAAGRRCGRPCAGDAGAHGTDGRASLGQGRRSMSNSSRPTPPGRCMWAMCAGAVFGDALARCWPLPAGM
jgi:arginyl-tRNA synthetase